MRPVLAVALVGIGLFSAGLGGVGKVDQQVAAADHAAAKARQVRDCPKPHAPAPARDRL